MRRHLVGVGDVTTVGCGDVPVSTVEGRGIAMVMVLVGIGFLSVLTLQLPPGSSRPERGDEREEILAALARLEAAVAELKLLPARSER